MQVAWRNLKKLEWKEELIETNATSDEDTPDDTEEINKTLFENTI